ncbi:esterase/lipase family protein [Halomonas binhaiensis]|uniref:Lecithin:cholesterol acyltransferase n=1 Tax=Halomonas binhaiensis TaxID=2562282 RepID=A0A5C1NFW4_9GAMM|nr:hypothetical protein [Halomonas binhaiensis]QEM82116.1 hypothetical protein E4T21_11575 [Halomonas binhaiensis]
MSDTYNIYDIFGSARSHMRPESENHVTEVPVYEGVVPVIFVPGVMGSNLINTETEQTWLVDGGWSLKGWLVRGARARKTILNPEQTTVYPGGGIPDGISRIWYTSGGGIIDNETMLRERGWGEVAKMYYGEFLVWLERNLNDHSILQRWRVRDRIKQQLQQAGQSSVGDVGALAEKCGEALQRFHFPVHACGYNWLRSNKESAERDLGKRVDEIMMGYQNAGHRCDRVILVTHSMGGLVSRYYSEVHGASSKIAGIVHGVMPTAGAAVFYRRMKCGTEGGGATATVLGATAREMTAVLSGAPGPLQLVPSPEYGSGWLKIFREGQQQVSLPTGSDPYSEIYLVRDQWWSMLETELADPDISRITDSAEKNYSMQEEWNSYAKIILQKVGKFHAQMIGQYHDSTYMFYSASEEFASYGNVTWTGSPFINSPMNMLGRTGWYGTERVAKDLDSSGRPRFTLYTISDYDEPGDATVPERSGRVGVDQAQRSMMIPTEHGAAYQEEEALWFTLGSILEVASGINS